MGQFMDLSGQVFGKWTVLRRDTDTTQRKKTVWFCRCECGKEQSVRADHLREGKAKSCMSCAYTKHGLIDTSEYRIYHSMKQRCTNPKNKRYADYGAGGITLCERWNSFENFIEDMGSKPGPEYSLDRIDNDKGYSPDNCRWATASDQQRNTRDNRFVTANGETRTIVEWSEITGLSFSVISGRLNKLGWSEQDAVTQPRQPGRHLKDRK